MTEGRLPAAFLAPRSVAVVGASRDPSKVGGSVLANLRAARLAPVSEAEALEMLSELRMAPALRAFRGDAAVDCFALARVIARFSRLLTDLPMLSEIELNPLVARPDGVLAVDARATVDGSPFAEVRE